MAASAKTPSSVTKLGDAKPASATEGGAKPMKSVATTTATGGMNSSTTANTQRSTAAERMPAKIAASTLTSPCRAIA